MDGISERLRRTLNDCRLSQAGLAPDVPHRSMQKYVSGAQKPGSEALQAISRRTGVNIHWLLTGEGEQFIDRSKLQPRPMELADITELMERFTNFENYFAIPKGIGRGACDSGSERFARVLLLMYQEHLLSEEHERVRDQVMPDLKTVDVDDMSIQEVAFAVGRLEEAWKAAGLPPPE